MRKLISSILVLFVSLLSFSCNVFQSNSAERIDLQDNLEWALCEESTSPQEALSLNFQPLEIKGKKNLMQKVGNDGKFVYVKAEFEISEELSNKDLGFFVSYIHFADKVWINGTYAGGYGRFPPKYLSAQYEAHFYSFPAEALNQEGKNTILIKVYCLGRAEISNHLFIGSYEDAKSAANILNFYLTLIYIIFQGGMFAAATIYMLIYFIERRIHKEYLAFSLSCLFTMNFAAMFYSSLFPGYYNLQINFLDLYRFGFVNGFLCGSFYLTVFIMQFIGLKIPKWAKLVANIFICAEVLFTVTAPTYNSLIERAPILTATSIIWLTGGIIICVIKVFDKNKQIMRRAHILFIGLFPLLIGASFDFYIHGVKQVSDMPFFMYFGWQISIIAYLIVLCVRFTRNSLENIYLNHNLQKAVEEQTLQLKNTATKLETEAVRSRKDLQMASIIQQKTFQRPSNDLFGWDVAVSYMPLSEVSGDMYDFYTIGSRLTGFSLFDVSGHGIAASLITMLSKNIIYQNYRKCYSQDITSSELMVDINNEIVRSKGSAENYLTGLLFQISKYDDDEVCELQMANAGHPHPFLYSTNHNSALSIVPTDTKNQYGVVGLAGMEVSYQNIKFKMRIGDVLVCFTDGVTEAENLNHDQFGREYIKKIIEENHDKSAQEILDALLKAVSDFAEGVEREDDITVLVLKRKSTEDFSLKMR